MLITIKIMKISRASLREINKNLTMIPSVLASVFS